MRALTLILAVAIAVTFLRAVDGVDAARDIPSQAAPAVSYQEIDDNDDTLVEVVEIPDHPWYIGERSPEWRDRLVAYLENTPGAVIGEIGLYRWKPCLSYAGQEEIFMTQLRLGAQRKLPVSIHCLRAWGRLYDLLRAGPRPDRGAGQVEARRRIAAVMASTSGSQARSSSGA